MAAKKTTEPMMSLGELREKVQVIYPRPSQFIARFAGVDPATVIENDPNSGKKTVPLSVARKAIEEYEKQRAEGLANQRAYDKYRKEQAEKARVERNAAAAKEQAKRAELTEKNAEKARVARKEAARRNAPAKSPRRAKEREAVGDPLSQSDWLKKRRQR